MVLQNNHTHWEVSTNNPHPSPGPVAVWLCYYCPFKNLGCWQWTDKQNDYSNTGFCLLYSNFHFDTILSSLESVWWYRVLYQHIMHMLQILYKLSLKCQSAMKLYLLNGSGRLTERCGRLVSDSQYCYWCLAITQYHKFQMWYWSIQYYGILHCKSLQPIHSNG